MKQLLLILLALILSTGLSFAEDLSTYDNTTWNVIRERLFNGENTKAYRFEDDIRFQVIGAKTPQDSAIFIQLIDELNELMEIAQIRLVDTDPNFRLTIYNRKSVRHYTNQPVAEEKLTELVKAGMAAPTAVNKQPWAFMIVIDRALLDQLADSLPYAKMLKQATSAIAVCGDRTKALDGELRDYWVQDCSAATQNILLGEESMGLGAVWTGVFPRAERVNTVKNILQLPEHITPLNVIAVGYPTGEDQPKDKWKPENVHMNKW